jgi:hypothetical protein
MGSGGGRRGTAPRAVVRAGSVRAGRHGWATRRARQLGCAVGAEAREMGRGAGLQARAGGAGRGREWAGAARAHERGGRMARGENRELGRTARMGPQEERWREWAGGGGEKRGGRGERLGRPSWAREGVGLKSISLFLFLFLSLFYLFQFDIMRKQMIR